jgi:2-dehydro-3-deoxy-D-arabinonate dehydratase
MRIIRYINENQTIKLAALTNDSAIYDLPYTDFLELIQKAEATGKNCLELVLNVISDSLPIKENLESLKLTVPINSPEVWASGVTYLKSRNARNYETFEDKENIDSYYDKVYVAERPELFIKSTNLRTIGPDKHVYLRSDSNWQIPEPELGLVIDRSGKILGYTIGNDMSSRDIEGENPLYLPQAKIWKHSCSIGPAIRLVETIDAPYGFSITCRIFRNGAKVFEDSASTSQLKRKYEELISFLLRDNEIFDGTILLTGTCIVPEDDFTLEDGDRVEIEIPGIGVLDNSVQTQSEQTLPASKLTLK